jgi:hypothetical protein
LTNASSTPYIVSKLTIFDVVVMDVAGAVENRAADLAAMGCRGFVGCESQARTSAAASPSTQSGRVMVHLLLMRRRKVL